MPKHLYEDEALAQEVFEEEKDAHYARRVEQELRDEELARQLARAEERALAAEERDWEGRFVSVSCHGQNHYNSNCRPNQR